MFKKIIAAIAAAVTTASVMAVPASAQPIGTSSDSVSKEYPIVDNSKNFSVYDFGEYEFYEKCKEEFGADKVFYTPSTPDSPVVVATPYILPGFGENYAEYKFQIVRNSDQTYGGSYLESVETYINFSSAADADTFDEVIGNLFDKVFGKPSKTGKFRREWTNVGIDNVRIVAESYDYDNTGYVERCYIKMYPGSSKKASSSTSSSSAAGTKQSTTTVKTTNVQFTKSVGSEQFTIKWNKFGSADAYGIYLYNASTQKYEFYKTVTGTQYTFKNLKKDTKYSFYVAALEKKNGKYYVKERSQAVAVKTKSIKKVNLTETEYRELVSSDGTLDIIALDECEYYYNGKKVG